MLKTSPHKRSLICLFGLIVAVIVLQLISSYPVFVEKYYSNGIYPYWSTLLRSIFGWIPFAIGDVVYTITVLFLLYSLFKHIRLIIKAKSKKDAILKFILQTLKFALALFIIFKLSWGLNYDRPKINYALKIEDSLYSELDLVDLATYLSNQIKSLDSTKLIDVKDHETLSKQAIKDYENFQKEHPRFGYKTPSIKPVLSSNLISKFAVEGYFNPFTGEANVNRNLPDFSIPFTYAHEMAHQLGIAKEDEANIIAYLTGIKSSNHPTKYAAYYSGLSYVLFEIYRANPQEFERLYDATPPIFKKNMQLEQEFWQSHRSQLFGYMNTVLDAYLKFNNQKSGVQSYREVVIWMFNYHKNAVRQHTD